jgi:citronellol/citronellal dehydrogenase
VAKYGMTMVTLGVAADEADAPIAANTLWPRTLIATAAVQNLLGGDEAMRRARTPEIYADSALAVLRRSPRECTGNSFIDDEVLAEEGVTDLSAYQADPSGELALDLFVDGWPE